MTVCHSLLGLRLCHAKSVGANPPKSSLRRRVWGDGDGVGLRFQSLCFVTEIVRKVCRQPIAAFRFRRVLFGTFSSKEKVRRISRVFCCILSIAASPFQISCSLPSQSDLLVTSLRSSPSAFDSFRANTEIRYTLARPATVTIFIARRDAAGQLIHVNTLAQSIYETKGSHGHTWLGDTAAGVFAESGLYIAVLQIDNNRYETTVRVFHF